jgi:tetratricopeptide (TPR) repeat protein
MTAVSDRLATKRPQQALEWEPDNPTALIALARQQLENHQPQAAKASVLRLLEREPLASQGFEILGKIAEMEGDTSRITLLAEIGTRRAPRALGPPAWLADEALRQGRYAVAFEQIDHILRVSPGSGGSLFPLLFELAGRPEFVTALGEKLATRPVLWSGFVNALIVSAKPKARDQILAVLQRRGALSGEELGKWIERLGREGRWGEAYARWAGELDLNASNRLTHIYNGGFEMPPSGFGFDWQMADSADVLMERTSVAGASGSFALRLLFLGRRVETIPLHQRMLLAAGTYRLQFRTRALDMRSDRGLQWVIRCMGARSDLAVSERVNESMEWTEQGFDFSVPEQGCPAQELGLRNAGAKGARRIIDGSIWFDDVAADRIKSH